MKAGRGCIWGLFQVSFVLCFAGGVVLTVLGQAFWRESITLDEVWWRLSQQPETRLAHERGTTDSVLSTVEARPAGQGPIVVVATTVAAIPIKVSSPTATSMVPPTPESAETNTPMPSLTPSPVLTASTPSATTSLVPSPSPVPTTLVEPTASATPVVVSPVSQDHSPADAAPDPGLVQLHIPKISLAVPIVLAPIINGQWDVSHLDYEAGHLEKTARPGDQGNVVLTAAARLDHEQRPGPFANISQLLPGDRVFIYYRGQAFQYEIDYLATVTASDIAVTYPSRESKLTLLTHAAEPRQMAVGILTTAVPE